LAGLIIFSALKPSCGVHACSLIRDKDNGGPRQHENKNETDGLLQKFFQNVLPDGRAIASIFHHPEYPIPNEQPKPEGKKSEPRYLVSYEESNCKAREAGSPTMERAPNSNPEGFRGKLQ
jgi:hypothetical protein